MGEDDTQQHSKPSTPVHKLTNITNSGYEVVAEKPGTTQAPTPPHGDDRRLISSQSSGMFQTTEFLVVFVAIMFILHFVFRILQLGKLKEVKTSSMQRRRSRENSMTMPCYDRK